MNIPPKISYSWIGTFEYSPEEGNWYFHDRNNWKIVIKKEKMPLKDRALKLMKKLANNQYDKTMPDLKDLKFINWLSENTPTPVTGAVALLLNNIVSSKTIQPFTLISNFIGEHLTVQIRELPKGHPCWFYSNYGKKTAWRDMFDEYLIVLPGLFFNFGDQKREMWEWPKFQNSNLRSFKLRPQKELNHSFNHLKSHRILHQYSILYYNYINEDKRVRICLHDVVTLVPYKKGQVCNCIPIPGKIKKNKVEEPESVNTPEVVITSPNVVESLEQLSRIWQDRFSKSVLISAPPGSGKENFALSIPYGNGRETENIMSLSLATGEKETLEKQLLGQKRQDGSIEEGLIAKAAKSALFLDEVHHPVEKAGIRASLLRPLEADEYFPVGTNELQKVDNVLFILATNLPLKGNKGELTLADIDPQDFWTRMTHVVQMKHPLDLKDYKKLVKIDENGDKFKTEKIDIKKTSIDILESFFKFFWWERIEKFFKVDLNALPENEQASTQLINNQIKTLKKVIEEGEYAKPFAEMLFEALDYQPQNLSIRGIRSIVSRMFSIAASNVSQGEKPYENVEEYKEKLKPVIEEIINIATLDQKSKKKTKTVKYYYLVQKHEVKT